MTFVVGASAHGSPGVSTALQLVASLWVTPDAVPVVVEADASGGVLAARYELSLSPGFVTLAESLRKFEAPSLIDHAQRLPSGVGCVSLSPSATAASAQLRSAGPYLGPYLAQSGYPVLLDVGTIVPDGKAVPAFTAADLMLWFVRPTREELLVLRHRLAECPQPDKVGIVLVGDTPYNAEQVSEALDVHVMHTLPIDRRGATAANLGGDDRFLRRSPLARSCTQLAAVIAERIGEPTSPGAPSATMTRAGAPAVAQPPAPTTADVDETVILPPVAQHASDYSDVEADPFTAPPRLRDVPIIHDVQPRVADASVDSWVVEAPSATNSDSPLADPIDLSGIDETVEMHVPAASHEEPAIDLTDEEIKVWQPDPEDDGHQDGDAPDLVVWVNDNQT